MLASVDFFITRFPYRIWALFRACHWKYVTNLPLTLTLYSYHYQVHTFLIFTNVLDIRPYLFKYWNSGKYAPRYGKYWQFSERPFFYGIGTLKKVYRPRNVTREPCWPSSTLREITWCSNTLFWDVKPDVWASDEFSILDYLWWSAIVCTHCNVWIKMTLLCSWHIYSRPKEVIGASITAVIMVICYWFRRRGFS